MDDLLSVRQVAKYLGLAEITIYKKVSAREIPFVKIGRSVRFDPDQVRAWKEAHNVKPIGYE